MITKRFISYLFLLVFFCSSSQIVAQSYDQLTKAYETKLQNDETALPSLSQFISKAKKENNSEKLVQGYKDAIYFSAATEKKLRYADSAITAAIHSQNVDLLTNAYLGKGIIYYSNYKRYKPALDEYLKAYNVSKNSKDEYLKHKVLYHLGVIKSYLGYYEEALVHFNTCIIYFEEQLRKNLHKNETFNNKKGYLNSLHQAVLCNINIADIQNAESLTTTGLQYIGSSKEFELEKAYFLKCRGIIDYKKNQFTKSLSTLNFAIPPINNKGDFTNLAVSYYYQGCAFYGLKDVDQAIMSFQKVDSIFKKNEFVIPELRKNYEFLIKYYNKNGDNTNELLYTKKLLKADSIIDADFNFLSSRIHKEYDTASLLDTKRRLDKRSYTTYSLIVFLLLCTFFLVFLLWKHMKNARKITANYMDLQKVLQVNHDQNIMIAPDNLRQTLADDLITEVLEKLRNFELKKQFVEKGITINKLAKRFNTNENYLSQVINEQKGLNFNKYISNLRINYVTTLLYYDKKYLNFKVEAMAELCGIASRQNFSDLFYEINGIRPKDFIKMRKKETEVHSILEPATNT